MEAVIVVVIHRCVPQAICRAKPPGALHSATNG
jgi:hypothetical protein